MEAIVELWNTVYEFTGPSIFIVGILLGFIGVVGQWSLYDKCGLPGIACLVPIWNIIVFLKIVGRPWWQTFYIVIPMAIVTGALMYMEPGIVQYSIFGAMLLGLIAFTIKVYIELCHAFGKRNNSDYLLILIFNGFYVLNLGLSHNAKYLGPKENQDPKDEKKSYGTSLKAQPA